jgi:hypothetical protein
VKQKGKSSFSEEKEAKRLLPGFPKWGGRAPAPPPQK